MFTLFKLCLCPRVTVCVCVCVCVFRSEINTEKCKGFNRDRVDYEAFTKNIALILSNMSYVMQDNKTRLLR